MMVLPPVFRQYLPFLSRLHVRYMLGALEDVALHNVIKRPEQLFVVNAISLLVLHVGLHVDPAAMGEFRIAILHIFCCGMLCSRLSMSPFGLHVASLMLWTIV